MLTFCKHLELYTQSVEFAQSLEYGFSLSTMPGDLISAGQNALALEVYEQLQRPEHIITALKGMAEAYSERGLVEESFDAIAQAITLAQTADLSALIENEEASLRNPYSQTNYTEAEIQARLADCLAEERSALIREIIASYSDISTSENLQRLLHQLTDDELRLEFAIKLLPTEISRYEISLIEDPLITDRALLNLIQWPDVIPLEDALAAIADMQQSATQAQALLDIYRYYELPTEETTEHSLQQLENLSQGSAEAVSNHE